MHAKDDLHQILHKSLYQFRYTGGEAGVTSQVSPSTVDSTFYLAGQSGSAAAIASMRMEGEELSKPALIKILVAEEITHVYLDSENGSQ